MGTPHCCWLHERCPLPPAQETGEFLLSLVQEHGSPVDPNFQGPSREGCSNQRLFKMFLQAATTKRRKRSSEERDQEKEVREHAEERQEAQENGEPAAKVPKSKAGPVPAQYGLDALLKRGLQRIAARTASPAEEYEGL